MSGSKSIITAKLKASNVFSCLSLSLSLKSDPCCGCFKLISKTSRATPVATCVVLFFLPQLLLLPPHRKWWVSERGGVLRGPHCPTQLHEPCTRWARYALHCARNPHRVSVQAHATYLPVIPSHSDNLPPKLHKLSQIRHISRWSLALSVWRDNLFQTKSGNET